MGTCNYCGKNAGFLKSKHKECESVFNEGKSLIVSRIKSAITESGDFFQLEKEIDLVAKNSYINAQDVMNLYSQGFDYSVDSILDDGVLSIEEEAQIVAFKKHFKFDQNILDRNGSYQRIIKAAILREILEGRVPKPKLNIDGSLPFLLQKEETLLWLFPNVEYYEQVSQTVYHGRASGVSVRIAKGVYYRSGTFKGHPVKVDQTKIVGKGIAAFTDKHIYFSSANKNFKLPYNKLVTITPYEDGIGVQKDGANTKPQYFKGIDGWFVYNLVSNLNQI